MAALVAAFETTGALVRRADQTVVSVPPEGVVWVGEGGDNIEQIMSPTMFAHELEAVCTVEIGAVDEAARDVTIDDMLRSLSSVVEADRTLGGAVEYGDIGAPEFSADEGEGAMKSAQFAVTLAFTTVGSPLA